MSYSSIAVKIEPKEGEMRASHGRRYGLEVNMTFVCLNINTIPFQRVVIIAKL